MVDPNPKEFEKSADSLDSAIHAWKAASEQLPEAGFSAGDRATLIARIRTDRTENLEKKPIASLFLPFGKMLGAAGIPALLLAVTFGWWIGQGNEPQAPLMIHSSKSGGEAVFTIANGGKTHRVYKSHALRGTSQQELFTTTTDAFSDQLNDGNGVTYYRID